MVLSASIEEVVSLVPAAIHPAVLSERVSPMIESIYLFPSLGYGEAQLIGANADNVSVLLVER